MRVYECPFEELRLGMRVESCAWDGHGTIIRINRNNMMIKIAWDMCNQTHNLITSIWYKDCMCQIVKDNFYIISV